MIRVGIVGSTGYGGCELVRFLLTHKEVEIKWVSSRTYTDEEYSSVYSSYFKLLDQQCVDEDITKYLDDVDVVFFATPQGVCAKMLNEEVLSKVKVIDLSADYRIKDVKTYEQWYGIDHASPQFIDEAVYGLCEINRDKVKQARLIANPGCYVTSISLPLMPLLKEKLIKKEGIVADSKSGVTGAGRGLTLLSHYPEINENMVPYKIGNHRHTPEIEQNLTDAAGEPVEIIFTPILAPMNRGILSTIYCDKAEGVTIEKIQNELEEFYKDKPFVDVLPLGQVATVKHVRLSNKCAISVHENKSKIIICSTIDNMVKGSAGQAIQNMNLMLGFDECEGLSTMATAF
jgi:N-acetyl-gamma-glutamyl-phosphate reductase